MKTISNIGIILVAAFLTTGCEQIDNIKNNFSKDKSAPKSDATSKKSDSRPAGEVLVKVGDWTMTPAEFTERLDALQQVVPDFDRNDKESRKLVLEELVRQQLLVEDARQSGLVNSKDIEEAVEEFRRTIIVREVARLKTENLSVTDQEAEDFYEQNRQLLVEPLQLRAAEIVVVDKERADAILVQLLQGADFAQIARESSMAESAANGGDLGVITEVPFQEMANALMSLEAGEVSGVFRGPDGFYIMKVLEKSGGNPIPFEQIKEEILQNQLMQKQQQVILDYIEQLRKSVTVEINDALL